MTSRITVNEDPWVFAASFMKNEDVKSVAVHVLPPPGTVDQDK